MKSRYLCSLLIVIAVLLSQSAAGQTIRIASFNLNWGNRRGDQVLEAIADSQADIICLQETTPQSEQFLRKHLAESYPEFHFVGHQGRYLAERFAFASKRKLRDLEFHPPQHGLFGFYTAEFSLDGHDVHLVNVHLSPFQVRRGSGVLAAMDALLATEDTHAAEVADILKSVDPSVPTIVAGDFNSISTFRAPQQILKHGLTDSFAAAHADADAHPTWRWPTKPLPIALRIDYIFHSSHFRTTESRIITPTGSDHSLLVSELEMQASDTPASASSDSANPP